MPGLMTVGHTQKWSKMVGLMQKMTLNCEIQGRVIK